MNTKNKITAVLIVSVIAMSAVSMALPAMGKDATSTAVITGSGSPPIIDYKFCLSDDADDLHTIPGTQVMPVPDGTKTVYKYVVVWDPNGAADIQTVIVTTYYPDGTFKEESQAVELASAEIVAVTNDAYAQNIINATVRDDIQSRCSSNEARMFREINVMSNCDPSGDYTVEAKACDQSGAWSNPFGGSFTYVSIKALAIDFNLVDYGTIIPCIPQVVSGDNDMNPPDSTEPTVRNQANDPFKLRIRATDMIGQIHGVVIPAGKLDARVYNNTMPAGETKWLSTGGKTFTPIMEPCATHKIDFSIHAPMGTCGDIYDGTIYLTAVNP